MKMGRLTTYECGDLRLNCPKCPKKEDCYDGEDCVDVLKERLAAYENICFDDKGHEVISVNRIAALKQAESEGRLYIAPCPDGTSIYYLPEDEMIDLEMFESGEILSDTYVHGYTEFILGEIGKKWFLSSEEAAALAAMEGNGNEK